MSWGGSNERLLILRLHFKPSLGSCRISCPDFKKKKNCFLFLVSIFGQYITVALFASLAPYMPSCGSRGRRHHVIVNDVRACIERGVVGRGSGHSGGVSIARSFLGYRWCWYVKVWVWSGDIFVYFFTHLAFLGALSLGGQGAASGNTAKSSRVIRLTRCCLLLKSQSQT